MRTCPLSNPDVREAIQQRRSFRAFLDRSVEENLIRKILQVARYSPSSSNMQPWQVFVLQGEKKAQLDQTLLEAFDQGKLAEPQLSASLPEWFEPFKSRRFACGNGLYQAAGIDRHNKAARRGQARQNFQAFGAPVVLIFAMDPGLSEGSVFDCGMFYHAVMLAALAEGLETCAEASLISWPDLLPTLLGTGERWRFLSGMALGYGDYQHKINRYQTHRAEVDDFCQF